MLNILSNRTYRHLFMAQVIALIGTGLATVALGLLAYDLAGDRAGGSAGYRAGYQNERLYSCCARGGGFADKFPRRTMLVTLDLVRALVAITLPFVTQIWEIYILIFILQAASAAFTPTFQATIPDILPDERIYPGAVSVTSGLRS
jgi:MFS family permease